jgi:L-fuconolactonase
VTPIADAHLHLFAEGFAEGFGGPTGTDGELIAYERLRGHFGIERGLVVGYEGDPGYAGNNDYILALADRHRWMAPLAYLPVMPPPTVELLRGYRECGAVGFAIYLPDASSGRGLTGWSPGALAEIRSQRAILSLNASPAATSLLASVIDGLVGCTILFSHLGLPGRFERVPTVAAARERLAPLLELAPREHVAVKFSGLYGISDPAHDFPHAAAQPFVDVLLDVFGPARLLWGSDFSPALDFVSFAQTADLRALTACSQDEVTGVMGGNLLRLLDDHQREE